MEYFSEQDFDKNSFLKENIKKAEYEGCTFRNCDFSRQHLSGFIFSDCRFMDCNLSLVSVKSSALKEIEFIDCKISGVDFSQVNPFLLELKFVGSIVENCIFQDLGLKKTSFVNCSLKNTDFSGAKLTEAKFLDCDLSDATFDNTDLQKADFRTSKNFRINPTKNQLAGAKFSRNTIDGLLLDFKINIE